MVNINSINNKPDANRTAKSIPIYGTSGALTEIGPLTSGQLIIGNSGNNPSASTLSSAAGTIEITNGAGTINLHSPDRIIQFVKTNTTALVHCTTAMVGTADTIPQQTDGDEVLTLSITPTKSTNYLLIEFNGTLGTIGTDANACWADCALFQDATANALAATWGAHESVSTNGSTEDLLLRHYMLAGTTSATTFKIRVGPPSANRSADLNGFNNARFFGGVSNTSLTIYEIRA